MTIEQQLRQELLKEDLKGLALGLGMAASSLGNINANGNDINPQTIQQTQHTTISKDDVRELLHNTPERSMMIIMDLLNAYQQSRPELNNGQPYFNGYVWNEQTLTTFYGLMLDNPTWFNTKNGKIEFVINEFLQDTGVDYNILKDLQEKYSQSDIDNALISSGTKYY
jgi:hypothetical protein